MPVYRRLGWATREIKDVRENRGTKNNITAKWQALETKFNRNVDKTAGHFCIVFRMSKVREISNFQEYQTTFWENQALFDIFGPMQYQKSSSQNV